MTPRLRSRYVYLRAVLPDDYVYLHLHETSSDGASETVLGGATPSFPERLAQRASGVLAQYLVVTVATNSRVGLVSVFGADFQNGHAHLAALKFDRTRSSPLMLFGVGLLIDYAFACWNFHKLYLDVAGYNLPRLSSGADRWFELEGRLKAHHFHDGELWDHHIFALYREKWLERARGLRALLQNEDV